MKHILLTGTAGFIGSNFVPYFLEKYQNYKLISLDNLTYAGNLENLKEVMEHPHHVFVEGSITNRNLIQNLFDTYPIEGIIHFAAESHVDNSIKNPGVFIETNVTGTFTLLDVAYKNWMDGPFTCKDGFHGARFHHISTDEVYGSLGDTGLFSEKTPYSPNSPYSASKASSDMIVRSYHHTYGLNTVITNCSNNYGPKQHDEKLIPTIIRNALQGNPIPIYGDGKNIRDWLYVPDHCKGIDLAFHQGKSGETYNIGGRNERTNLQIVRTICELLDKMSPLIHKSEPLSRHSEHTSCHSEPLSRHSELLSCHSEPLSRHSELLSRHSEPLSRHSEPLSRHSELLSRHSERSEESTPNTNTDSSPLAQNDVNKKSYKDLITFVKDRAGHDRRYAIDATKIETELGWKADEDFESGIVKTIEWYLKHYQS